jgi:hypothetical protein
MLAALAAEGLITWTDNRLDGTIGNAQFKAYGHALSFAPDLLDYEWVLVVDMDEFLVLNRQLFPSLHDFCDWHASRGADTVAINWTLMRSEEIPVTSGLPLSFRNQKLLTEKEVGEGIRLVKSLSRPNRVVHSEAHVPFADERSGLVRFHAAGSEHRWHRGVTGHEHSPKFADSIIADGALLHHYIFKSSDEWIWKNARNPGDHQLKRVAHLEPMREERVRNFIDQFDATELTTTRRATVTVPNLVSDIATLKSTGSIGSIHQRLLDRYLERLAELKKAYVLSPQVDAWSDDSKRFLEIAGIRQRDCINSQPKQSQAI